MKKILISTAVAAIFAATTLFTVSNDDSLSTLFEDNVEALADTESPDPSRPLGHHLETCGQLFYKYDYLAAHCVNLIEVCDRNSNNRCNPTICTNHN